MFDNWNAVDIGMDLYQIKYGYRYRSLPTFSFDLIEAGALYYLRDGSLIGIIIIRVSHGH